MPLSWRIVELRATFEIPIKDYREYLKKSLMADAKNTTKNVVLRDKLNRSYMETEAFREKFLEFIEDVQNDRRTQVPAKDRAGQINGFYLISAGDWTGYIEVNYRFSYIVATLALHKSFPKVPSLRKELMELLIKFHTQKDEPP